MHYELPCYRYNTVHTGITYFEVNTRYIYTVHTQFDASRRGKKELKSSRDKKSKARTVVGRGGEEPAMSPRICVTTRREREQKGEDKDSKWYGKKEKKKIYVYTYVHCSEPAE